MLTVYALRNMIMNQTESDSKWPSCTVSCKPTSLTSFNILPSPLTPYCTLPSTTTWYHIPLARHLHGTIPSTPYGTLSLCQLSFTVALPRRYPTPIPDTLCYNPPVPNILWYPNYDNPWCSLTTSVVKRKFESKKMERVTFPYKGQHWGQSNGGPDCPDLSRAISYALGIPTPDWSRISSFPLLDWS